MPAGNSTARPYNRSEKAQAKSKKKIAARTNNKNINKLDGNKSNAKMGKGNFLAGDLDPSNSASTYMRQMGALLDNEEAAELRRLHAKAKSRAKSKSK